MVGRLADRVRALLPLLGPLGAGSRVLLLRLVGRFGWKAVLAGAAVLAYAADRHRKWIWAGLAVLCALAWMHAPNRDEEQAGEEQPPAAPEDPFPSMVWDLIGDAPGVHIKRIVEWLHETELDTACTAADVRAGLTRRGIPMRASVWGLDRDGEKRVNQGVHKADLQAWLEGRSPTTSVPLSKTCSNPTTTALTSGVANPATDVATPPTPAE